MIRANGVLSAIISQSQWSRADRSTFIKAQFSALDMSVERRTSNEMEDTYHASCARPADERIEAADCEFT